MATFTPGLIIDPMTGQETITAEAGTYNSGAGREAAVADFNQSQQDYLSTTAETTFPGSTNIQPIPPQDHQYLQDLANGYYNEMLQWGSLNLDPEITNQYDKIMASGDVKEMEAAVRWLYKEFMSSDASFTEDYSEANQQYTPSDSEDFAGLVYETIPNYDEMTDWAALNLSPELIEQYDQILGGDDDQLKAKAVAWLAQQFANAN